MKKWGSSDYTKEWQIVLDELSAFPNTLGELLVTTKLVTDEDNLTELVKSLSKLPQAALFALIENRLMSETFKKRKELLIDLKLEGYFDLNLIRNSKTLGEIFIKEKTPITLIDKNKELTINSLDLKIEKQSDILNPDDQPLHVILTDVNPDSLLNKFSKCISVNKGGTLALKVDLERLHKQYHRERELTDKVKNSLDSLNFENIPKAPKVRTPLPKIMDLTIPTVKYKNENMNLSLRPTKVEIKPIDPNPIVRRIEKSDMTLNELSKDKEALTNYYLTYLKGKHFNRSHFNLKPGYFDEARDRYVQYEPESKKTFAFLKFTTWMEMPIILMHESPYPQDQDYAKVSEYLRKFSPMKLQGPLGETYHASVSKATYTAGILVNYKDYEENRIRGDIATRTGLSQLVRHRVITPSMFAQNHRGTALKWPIQQGGWVSAILFLMKMSFIPLFDCITEVPKIETLIDADGRLKIGGDGYAQ